MSVFQVILLSRPLADSLSPSVRHTSLTRTVDRAHLKPSALHASGHLLAQPLDSGLNVTQCRRWRGERIKLLDFVFSPPLHSQRAVVRGYKGTDGFLTSAS